MAAQLRGVRMGGLVAHGSGRGAKSGYESPQRDSRLTQLARRPVGVRAVGPRRRAQLGC